MNKEYPISTYPEYINESMDSLIIGLKHYEYSQTQEDPYGSDHSIIYAYQFFRYSYLMICHSLEAAVNALLLSLKLEKSIFKDLEKLSTLLKVEFYCTFKGKKIDHGNDKYCRIKRIISSRNEFVHPKPNIININNISDSDKREYPKYLSGIESKHVLWALEDTLSFLAWICYDICNMEIKEGAFLLGLNSISRTSSISILKVSYIKNLDVRTLGLCNEDYKIQNNKVYKI